MNTEAGRERVVLKVGAWWGSGSGGGSRERCRHWYVVGNPKMYRCKILVETRSLMRFWKCSRIIDYIDCCKLKECNKEEYRRVQNTFIKTNKINRIYICESLSYSIF